MIQTVELSRQVEKQLRKVPKSIFDRLYLWMKTVEEDGLEEARKRPGLHDEALRGDRKGQRSIRLSKSYRAIYRIIARGRVEVARVEEVTKHDY
jgi:proteic killer suppression protein